jgi:hypothetical protein
MDDDTLEAWVAPPGHRDDRDLGWALHQAPQLEGGLVRGGPVAAGGQAGGGETGFGAERERREAVDGVMDPQPLAAAQETADLRSGEAEGRGLVTVDDTVVLSEVVTQGGSIHLVMLSRRLPDEYLRYFGRVLHTMDA